MDNTFFHSVEEGAKAALDSGAEIVVICAAGTTITQPAPESEAELPGERALFVVAGAPASQPELEAQGITRFISVREQRTRKPSGNTLRNSESNKVTHDRTMRAKFSEMTYEGGPAKCCHAGKGGHGESACG